MFLLRRVCYAIICGYIVHVMIDNIVNKEWLTVSLCVIVGALISTIWQNIESGV